MKNKLQVNFWPNCSLIYWHVNYESLDSNERPNQYHISSPYYPPKASTKAIQFPIYIARVHWVQQRHQTSFGVQQLDLGFRQCTYYKPIEALRAIREVTRITLTKVCRQTRHQRGFQSVGRRLSSSRQNVLSKTRALNTASFGRFSSIIEPTTVPIQSPTPWSGCGHPSHLYALENLEYSPRNRLYYPRHTRQRSTGEPAPTSTIYVTLVMVRWKVGKATRWALGI